MIVIIGAGLTGLSIAYYLEQRGNGDYLLLEAENKVGGLCRSLRIDGFCFDYAIHMLHLRKPDIVESVKELMGENLAKQTRRAGILFDGIIVPYPFQMNLYPLTSEKKRECLMGAIKAAYEFDEKDPPTNFAEWVLWSLGEGIAKHFMFPYNRKLWKVELAELSTEWLGRFVPRPNLEQIIEGAICDKSSENIGYNREFWYPLSGGIDAVPRAFLPYIRAPLLGQRVVEIDPERRNVIVAGGESYAYDVLVSTMPVVELIRKMKGVPSPIRRAAMQLRCNTVYTVILGVDRAPLADYHWLYAPQEDIIFHRISFPSNYSPNMAPPGKSSICAEISFLSRPNMSNEELVEQTIHDLRKVGVLRNVDNIVLKKVVSIKNAYVIFDEQRSSNMALIQTYLRDLDIYSVGRYGRWEYSSMEDAIVQGALLAKGLGK